MPLDQVIRLTELLPEALRDGRSIFIAGQWQAARSGETFATVNPATGREIARIARGARADVDAAVAAASAAAPGWAAMDGGERGRIMRRIAEAMRDHREAFGLLDTLDAGRPIADTRGGSVDGAAALFEFYAGLTDKIHGKVVPVGPGTTGLVEREPCGVVGAIAPWNYPLGNAATKVAPIIACGNAMVLKPAEQTPLSALYLAEVMKQAGLPDGVVNVVPGLGPEAGAALLEHPDVPTISFTGSTATGRMIAEAAGRRLKSVVLELGGKSPLIVFDDADIAQAAEAAVFSTFMNAGQTCTSCARVLVARPVLDAFLAACRQAARRLRIGDPMDPATQIGPIVSREQLERVERLVADGKAGGATFLELDLPGYRPIEGGCFFRPAIATGQDPDGAFARQEIFGPVMAVQAFDTEEDAYALANDTEYGLAASVWTTSFARTEAARRRIRTGIVWINCIHHYSANTPVSGHKASGLGIEYGVEAVEQYMRVKTTIAMHGGWRSPFA